MVTLGLWANEYPEPRLVMVNPTIRPFATCAVAVAATPLGISVPSRFCGAPIVTVGVPVYPANDFTSEIPFNGMVETLLSKEAVASEGA